MIARKVAGLLGTDAPDRSFENGLVSAAGVVVDRLGPEDADWTPSRNDGHVSTLPHLLAALPDACPIAADNLAARKHLQV